jgi:hypothetical protein
MAVKFTYLLHWLGIRWPYAIATALAIFFVILKAFPLLKAWADLFMYNGKLKKLGLVNKLQPQLVSAAEANNEQKRKKIDQQSPRRGKEAHRGGWFGAIGIATFFVGFVVLLVWFFDR